MIITTLNSTDSVPDIPGMQQALDFLKTCPTDQPDGTIDIDGKEVFAIVSSYETKREKGSPRFEAHRKYIDVQFLLSGRELMGWAPLDSLTVTDPYNEDKDILFGNAPDDASAFTSFSAGQAVILFPSDAHAPGLAKGTARQVKKVVVKISTGL